MLPVDIGISLNTIDDNYTISLVIFLNTSPVSLPLLCLGGVYMFELKISSVESKMGFTLQESLNRFQRGVSQCFGFWGDR